MARVLTFIDLCAGIGGFRHGLETAGLKCIGYAEFNEPARRSYEAMYDTEGEWTARDINDLKSEDIPQADIWTFGFPCQDISLAGKKAGLAGRRSGLFYKIIDLVKGKKENEKPKILIAENVKNLLKINRGWDFARVLIELDGAGYDVQWQLVNSKDYGVPQNRERVYIIGLLRTGRFRGRKILPVKETTPTSAKSSKKLLKGKYRQAEDFQSLKGLARTLCATNGNINNSAPTGLYAIPEERRVKTLIEGKFRMNENIRTPSGLARTLISCEGGGCGANASGLYAVPDSNKKESLGRFHHEGKTYLVRRLTPRECFRLQGFPDRLYDRAAAVNPERELYKQAGNAVTATIPYEIGKSILRDD